MNLPESLLVAVLSGGLVAIGYLHVTYYELTLAHLTA